MTFIGSRFKKEEFAKTRRLLLVTITLPRGVVDAVVTTVTHERVGEEDSKALVNSGFNHIHERGRYSATAELSRTPGKQRPLFAKD